MEVLLQDKASKWAQLSFAPIHCFSVEDFGVSLEDLAREIAPAFSSLSPDYYDVKREQIQLLQEMLPFTRDETFSNLWKGYFLGDSTFEKIEPFYGQLNSEHREMFDQILPFRYRSISCFSVNVNDSRLKRFPVGSFTQLQAHHENALKYDWRQLPRVFTEIDDEHVQSQSFSKIIFGIVNKLLTEDPLIKQVQIIAHHVKVISRANRIKGNSPEGIHQDGYPYIVTALVIERKNVLGGESQIFDNDKETPIFTCTLKPGHGILQPDLGTGLWHRVTPIHPLDNSQAAIRSTLGFDIQIVK